MDAVEKRHLQRAFYNAQPIDARASEDTGQLREADGTVSCQLKVPSLRSDAPSSVVPAPLWSYFHLRSGTAQSCGDCGTLFVRRSLGLLSFLLSPCAQATSVHEQSVLLSKLVADGRLPGTARSGPHLQSITRGTATLGGVSKALAATPLNMRKDSTKGRGGPRGSARGHETDVEVEVKVLEGHDKSQGCDGTKGVVEVPLASAASDSALADATNADAIRTKLGELQRLLNRKGSLSATQKKNAEANTRAYDLNQKTMQALDTLAEENEAFEVTMIKVAFEHEEGDVLYAMASEVAEELDRAQKGPRPITR